MKTKYSVLCKVLRVNILLVLLLCTCTMQAQFLSAPAFPGAEGFGRYTTGGRGGQVIHVTNLNDSGTGSLRAAIEATGKRIIVFDVAGTIELNSDLKIVNDNISILGQTAPGNGICLRNYSLKIHANNVIVRYIRCRMGDTAKNENDAMSADNQTGNEKRNIIIDHCSISWCVDECGTFYGNENFTLQWCILSESLTNSVHGKGSHGYGGIWGGRKAAFHHNLLAHHNSRNPRFDHGYVSELAGVVDYINNVVYNWGGNSTYGGENKKGLEPKKFNMINNYYKPGPRTINVSKIQDRLLNPTTKCSNCNSSDQYDIVPGKFYISGNYVNGSSVSMTTSSASDKYLQFDSNYNIDAFKSNCLLNSRELSTDNDFSSYNTVSLHSATNAYNKIINYCGASYSRDAVDTRIASELQDGTYTYTGSNGSTYGLIDSQSDVGGWPTLSGTAATDTDQDGIPDSWESAHGLNNGTDNSNTYTLDQYGFYTDLEVYANYLVQDITKAERADATSSFDEYYPLDANTITPISTSTASAPYITANASGRVIITCVTNDATIYYTTDGSTPTLNSKQYSGAFTVENACTVKAMAVVSGMTNSNITSFEVTTHGVAKAYIVDPDDPVSNAVIGGVDGISMTYGACTDWGANSAGITLSGVTFPYYAAATSSNGSSSTSLATNKPTGNSYWIFTPTVDGTLTLAVHSVGKDKAICITEDGTMIGATLIDVDGTTSSTLTTTTLPAQGTLPSSASWSGGIQFEVKAGSTYTYSLAGSKGHFCGFIFDAEKTETAEETTWDFSEFTSTITASGNNYTTSYNGLTLVGNSNSSYTNDYISASAGFHMNGTSTATTRYIEYTPATDGVMTVFYTSNNTSATDRITAIGTQITTGTSIAVGEDGVLAYGYTDGSTQQSIQAELKAGTTYYIYFANGGQAIKKLIYSPGATLDNITSLTLVDGEEYTQGVNKVYEEVSYSKVISETLANKWTSLYVPFVIDIEDYAGLFDIAEIHAMNPYRDTNNDGVVNDNDDDMLIVEQITTGITEPNTPYLIRAKEAGTIVITPKDKKTYAATNGQKVFNTSKATYTFTGLNSSVTATPDNDYYYMSAGTISHRVTGSTIVKPNRWYMTISNASAGAKPSFSIAVIGEEDDVTGVKTVKSVQPSSTNHFHTMDGRKVKGSNLPAGMYITNNKKIIVK